MVARYLGIHHMVSNYARGLLPGEKTASDLHHLYIKVFPEIAMTVELAILTDGVIPPSTACHCTTSLFPAPLVFRQTLTQPDA